MKKKSNCLKIKLKDVELSSNENFGRILGGLN